MRDKLSQLQDDLKNAQDRCAALELAIREEEKRLKEEKFVEQRRPGAVWRHSLHTNLVWMVTDKGYVSIGKDAGTHTLCVGPFDFTKVSGFAYIGRIEDIMKGVIK